MFVTAGFWQLRRAEEKRLLFANFDAGSIGSVIEAPAAGADLARLRYSTVAAAGRFDAAHQVLLDARTRNGKAGYEVLTPLLRPFPDNRPALLVNRGWVPADPDRTRLPDVSVTTEPRNVTGLLDRLPRAALSAGPATPDEAAGWPRRMLYPTAAEIRAALGYPLEDYQLLLSRAAPDGYQREWRPAVMTPRQHLGYAVQWFAMAAALVVLYAVVNIWKAAAAPTNI